MEELSDKSEVESESMQYLEQWFTASIDGSIIQCLELGIHWTFHQCAVPTYDTSIDTYSQCLGKVPVWIKTTDGQFIKRNLLGKSWTSMHKAINPMHKHKISRPSQDAARLESHKAATDDGQRWASHVTD